MVKSKVVPVEVGTGSELIYNDVKFINRHISFITKYNLLFASSK